MINDQFIKAILCEKVNMTPSGFVADELTVNQFHACHELFFDKIFEISSSDISSYTGYGEFTEEGKLEYATCRDYLVGDFSDEKEGYWYNWREMFNTTMLDQQFFEHYFNEMLDRAHYCEGQRYLVNNNTFFVNIITDGKTQLGFSDWSRAGICDFLLDFAILDVNKPYLKVPELLYAYCEKKSIVIPDFKERFLCMAYLKGLHVLRWHASIDDVESCTTIMQSMRELKDRIYAL